MAQFSRALDMAFSSSQRGFFMLLAEKFFSLSIKNLQKEEIRRNQKKSVSGGDKIKSLNFANDNENDNCHPEGKSTSTLTSTF